MTDGDAPMLVSTEWLAPHLGDPALAVVDMRWHEDGSGRSRYSRGHILGAAFLDWASDIVDPDGAHAFMLAPPQAFATAMERAGIGDGSHVVAYADRRGSGPYRLWWACRVYGHRNVSVLDGGFDKWTAEGHPVSNEDAEPSAAVTWTPGPPDLSLLADADAVARAEHGDVAVLDSRPPAQFRGEAVWFEAGPVPADADGIARTPRGDLRAGRVPWASNVPAASLYEPDFTLKPPDQLRELFAGAGATPGRPAIAYCGVAISAAALLFALRRAGFEDVRLYDGSWEEWGRDVSRPVARGEQAR
jgi:thiosulfate/3-mercaptopyruvate sulfurtransferase